MASSTRVRLLVAVLLNSGVVQSSYNSHRRGGLLSRLDEQQVDYGDLTDDVEPYSFDTISKRSSKGSCTCTCETEPAVETAAAGTSAGSGPNSVSFMRTGPSKTNHIDNTDKTTPEEKAAASNDAVKSVFDDDQLEDRIETVAVANTSNELAKDKSKVNQAINHGARDNWGHGSRFPWKKLPDTMCFRQPCQADKDCCLKFSICDRSANVCVDCWYGSTCTSEQQCCHKYPYCQRVWKTSETGQSYIAGGKCVNKL